MSQEVLGYKFGIDAEEAKASVGSFRKQLRDAQKDLIEMASKFGESSEQAIKAAKKVGELRDRIGDAKSMAEAFNPDARFKAVSQSVQGIAGAFAAVQGAMATFGVESEDLQKSLLKVQGALALSEGLNTFLDNGIQGFKNLGAKAKDTFLSIKAEIGSTGIGALLLGIAAAAYLVYENFDKLTGVTEEATRTNKAYADTLEETNQAGTEAIKNITNVKNAFNDAKKGVISKQDALKIYNETLGDSLGKTNDISVAEKNLNEKADDYVKATMLKAQANAMFAMSAKLQAESLTADTKDNVSGMQKALIGLGSALSFGYIGYKDAVKKAQDINTKEIKDNLQKQVETLNTEGQKLLTNADEIQKKANIKIGVKSDKEAKTQSEKDREQLIKDFAKSKQDLATVLSLGNKGLEEEIQSLADQEIETEKNKNAEIQKLNEESARFKMEVAQKVAKKKEEDIAKEKQLEKDRFEESLKWATTYADSAAALSDALYASKLAGVEKGSKEEERIMRQQFETNKRIQIAQTIISGLNGIVNAISQKSVLPHPLSDIAKGVNAAMIGATTALTVRKIAQQQFGSTSMSIGSTGSSGGGSAPMSPGTPVQQTITSLNQSSINAIGNQAIKAYVVETDIRNSQTRVNRILTNSRFK